MFTFHIHEFVCSIKEFKLFVYFITFYFVLIDKISQFFFFNFKRAASEINTIIPHLIFKNDTEY